MTYSAQRGRDLIIYYDANFVSQSDLDSIRALTNLHLGTQAQICCVPRDDAAFPIILTAWTHWLKLPAYDAARIQSFVNRFLGRGPE